ncbi:MULTISPECIES: phage protein Gp37 [Serratia]|uniref:phage protein Gp37 n=1 Tax=Serratia TaxID=613 RepID=UPI00065FDFE7|nr:phage protein Gp37 [Serratia sp. 506_PEND]
MITQTENAIIVRLHEGLGIGPERMVFEVASYGGQLADLGQIVRQLPAVWVEYAGVQSSKPVNTHRNKFWVVSRFNVYVVDYSVRSEESHRKAGPVLDEPGTNRIINAVRRLLTRQDFGLSIRPLMPGRVRNLFSTVLNNKAISAYSCEFETRWIEEALDLHHWPAPDGETHPDYVFKLYNGRLDPAVPYHDSTDMRYFLPGGTAAAAEDIVPTEEAIVLTVKAKDGVRVPREDDPHRYITHEAAVEVEASAYYLRRLQEGDLVIAAPTADPVAPADADVAPVEVAASTDKGKGKK